MKQIHRAFILAAGEGTRLRPLTAKVPKPLLPLFHKPLISFALDHCIALGIEHIALNTRYLHEAFYELFQVPESSTNSGHVALGEYEGKSLLIFREYLKLDTGGGLLHARSFLEQGTFLLHNGDIVSDAPLEDLMEFHLQSGSMVTLLLHHDGGVRNVTYNKKNGLIEGFSGVWNSFPVLQTSNSISMVYSGIAVIEPSFLDWISREGPASIIPALQKAIDAKQKVSGFVAKDDYFWSDLGTPESYLETHLCMTRTSWRPPLKIAHNLPWPECIHPLAVVDSSAILEEMVVVGADAAIHHGARLKNCILLPGATVAPNTKLAQMIVGKDFFLKIGK